MLLGDVEALDDDRALLGVGEGDDAFLLLVTETRFDAGAAIEERTFDCITDVALTVANGAGEVLLTSWDRDGSREGYDLELLRAVSAAVDVPVIASGGANSAQHMAEGLAAGASAVLAASIFHDHDTTVQQVKRELAALGQEVRL